MRQRLARGDALLGVVLQHLRGGQCETSGIETSVIRLNQQRMARSDALPRVVLQYSREWVEAGIDSAGIETSGIETSATADQHALTRLRMAEGGAMRAHARVQNLT